MLKITGMVRINVRSDGRMMVEQSFPATGYNELATTISSQTSYRRVIDLERNKKEQKIRLRLSDENARKLMSKSRTLMNDG
jgi:hypothetical protein